jgi:hypothetical protein
MTLCIKALICSNSHWKIPVFGGDHVLGTAIGIRVLGFIALLFIALGGGSINPNNYQVLRLWRAFCM